MATFRSTPSGVAAHRSRPPARPGRSWRPQDPVPPLVPRRPRPLHTHTCAVRAEPCPAPAEPWRADAPARGPALAGDLRRTMKRYATREAIENLSTFAAPPPQEIFAAGRHLDGPQVPVPAEGRCPWGGAGRSGLGTVPARRRPVLC